MSVFQCKMCGAMQTAHAGESVAVCDRCGSRQTIPTTNDEHLAGLYRKANSFRLANEHGKAWTIYKQILHEDSTQAEAHWGVLLCRYGIEYVENPVTRKRVPAVTGDCTSPVFSDDEYMAAIACAEEEQKELYEAEAKEIDRLQKGIPSRLQAGELFDIFLSCRGKGSDGQDTPDAELAQELRLRLVQEAFHVFFAPVTLAEKTGPDREREKDKALEAAAVMIVLGTMPEHFAAADVRDEWSRYLDRIKSGAEKTLIPVYKDMNPCDLPKELVLLSALDMSSPGFAKDLVRELKKLLEKEEPDSGKDASGKNTGSGYEVLLESGNLALKGGEWEKAGSLFDQVLNSDSENVLAYLGKLMADMRVSSKEDLKNCAEAFEHNVNYRKALQFAHEEVKNELQSLTGIRRQNDDRDIHGSGPDCSADGGTVFRNAAECPEKEAELLRGSIVSAAKELMSENTIEAYEKALAMLSRVSDDAEMEKLAESCRKAIENIKRLEETEQLESACKAKEKEKQSDKYKKVLKVLLPSVAVLIALILAAVNVVIPNSKYKAAVALYESGKYQEAITAFEELDGYKDSAAQIEKCKAAYLNSSYEEACQAFSCGDYQKAILVFEMLGTFQDSAAKAVSAKYELACQLQSNGQYLDAVTAFKELDDYLDSQDRIQKIYRLPGYFNMAPVGYPVFFGTYEQNNNLSDGTEEIEWIVLAKQTDRMLIISKYGLDMLPYNKTYEKVTWEDSSLRKWLNGEFFNMAFSSDEKGRIEEVSIPAENNSQYNTDAGNDTPDKIFMLSVSEAKDYFASNAERRCIPTGYSEAKGAGTIDDTGFCWWWLRSPGYEQTYAAVVRGDGSVGFRGIGVHRDLACIRPAVWVNLDA